MKTLKLLLTCCLPVAVLAQTSALEKRGSKQFDEYAYTASIETLEAVEVKNTDVYRKLAKSYDITGDYVKAEACMAKVCESPSRIPQDLIDYARALMKNQKYAEAEQQLRAYEKLKPGDSEVQRFYLLNESLAKYRKYGANFSVMPLEMNSDHEEFAPVVQDNKLYFASTRYKTGFSLRRWSGNELAFLDIYSAELNGVAPQNPEKLPVKSINGKYHEGPVAFSREGREMYITRDNYDSRSSNGTRHLQLLVSTRSGDTWSEPVELPFNSKEYSTGHATVSADGNTMIFASDMPGGKGGVDLYKSVRVNGNWSAPENLAEVNTTGDEVFPFLHEGGVLLFSSNGHPGFGGLDLFVGQWKNNAVVRFHNLGAPMNSPEDDFSLWLDAAQTKGYFASNRSGGKGNDDIYAFSMQKPFKFARTLKGIARDKEGNPLVGAVIRFKDAKGQIGETVSGTDGSYQFETETIGSYTLDGSKEKYFPGSASVSITDESPDELTQDLVLEKDPGFALLALIADRDSKAPLEGVKITLINNMTGEQQVLQTNAKGEIMEPIRDKKINDRISYNIRFEKDGYLARTATYNRLLDKEGTYMVSDELNMTMQKMDVGVDLAKAIDLKPIYFDVAKYAIRPDAAVELDKIVKIMNENPTMTVELGSHTDCRGTAKKNKDLSQKRAMASADYIKKRISNPERISGLGYGETKILNGCACEGKIKSTCSEAEHQENRRTEFIILKM